MVQFLQSLELFHPLLQRETAQHRHVDGLVEPFIRLTGPEVKVALAFVQAHVVTESFQFVVDGFFSVTRMNPLFSNLTY